MVFNLPIEPPPNAVQAASADVAPVPPLAIGNVPVTLAVKETLFNLPIVPPPKAVHAADAVVAPVPPWAIDNGSSIDVPEEVLKPKPSR